MTTQGQIATALESVGDVRLNEPMARHTTLGVGGPADVYVTVRSSAALTHANRVAIDAGVEPFVLGSGSNSVIADGGIRGVVIDNRARREEARGLAYCVESGTSFASFARRMCRAGIAGLAWAVGIPGTLGGAVVYNAGAYGGCLADVLTRVRLLDPAGGETWHTAGELGLVYRASAFTRGLLAGRTVLEAELALTAGNPTELLAEAASYDTRRLTAQPRGRNAGSMFKNPPENPAWRLIEAVGLRGERRGDAAISERHANFFINLGQAQAADVLWLVEEAERRVQEQHGVTLEREVGFMGAW